jgi:hypothetical protein
MLMKSMGGKGSQRNSDHGPGGSLETGQIGGGVLSKGRRRNVIRKFDRTKEQDDMLLKLFKGIEVDKNSTDYEQLMKLGCIEEGHLTTRGKAIARLILKRK